MALDFTRVKKQVTYILNVCSPGTYTATVSPNYKSRNEDAISDAVFLAAKDVNKLRASLASDPNRSQWAFSHTVTHAANLPIHLGEPDVPEIQAYNGAAWQTGVQRDVNKIESYRQDAAKAAAQRLYDLIPHNENGSTLSGYYNFINNKVYFTGFACRVTLYNVDDDDVETTALEVDETIVIGLAVQMSLKEGDNLLPIAQQYIAAAQQGLKQIQIDAGMILDQPSTADEALGEAA